MKLVPKVLIGLSVFFGGMSLVQYTVQHVLQLSNTQIVAQKTGYSASETTDIVVKAFQSKDLTPPQSGENERFASVSTREHILTYLQDKDVEVYVLEQNDDIRWRIYNKDALQYQLYFSNDIDDDTRDIGEPLVNHTTRTQPVALLITGTKYKDLKPLLSVDTPLNIALEPTSPFALRNAVLGARHWHEIVLDIRNSTEFVTDALPFSTALLSPTTLPIESMNVIVTSNTNEITTEQTELPNGKIWRLNMANLSAEDVKEWIDTLPTSLKFVRLSYWDITPQ